MGLGWLLGVSCESGSGSDQMALSYPYRHCCVVCLEWFDCIFRPKCFHHYPVTCLNCRAEVERPDPLRKSLHPPKPETCELYVSGRRVDKVGGEQEQSTCGAEGSQRTETSSSQGKSSPQPPSQGRRQRREFETLRRMRQSSYYCRNREDLVVNR